MAIVTRHDAVGVAPVKDNGRFAAGMQMVQRQQERDNAMRLAQMEPLKYNIGGTYGGIGIGDQKKKAKPGMGAEQVYSDYAMPPSRAEQGFYIEQSIRNNAYDPDTVRDLRENMRLTRQALRDPRLDATARQETLQQLDSARLNLMASVYPMPSPSQQQSAPKQPTASDFFSDKKNYKESYLAAKEELSGEMENPPTQQQIHERMLQNYRGQEQFLSGLASPPLPQAPKGDEGEFKFPWLDQAGAAGSAATPVAGQTQTQTQAQAMQPAADRIAGQIGDFGGSPVYGVPNVLAMPSQPPVSASAASQQAPAAYPMESVAGMKPSDVRDTWVARGGGGLRTWTSADGQFSVEGEFQGLQPSASQDGSPMALIKRKDSGKVVSVPLDQISSQDRDFALTGGNMDLAYDLRNKNRSAGINYMNLENPSYAAMRAPVPRETPTPEALAEQRSGRYGLGGADAAIREGRLGVRREAPPVYQQPELEPWRVATVPGFREPSGMPATGGVQPQVSRGIIGVDVSPGDGSRYATNQMDVRDTSAYTQLLAQMTPSQRRAYNKKMLENPGLYANRERIAEDELNRRGLLQRRGVDGLGNPISSPAASTTQPAPPPQSQPASPQQGKPVSPAPSQAAPGRWSPPSMIPDSSSTSGTGAVAGLNMSIKDAARIIEDPNSSQQQMDDAIGSLIRQNVSESVIQQMEKNRDAKKKPASKSSVKTPVASASSEKQSPKYNNGLSSREPYLENQLLARGASLDSSPVASRAQTQPGGQASLNENEWDKFWKSNPPVYSAPSDIKPRTWTNAKGDKTFEGAIVQISQPVGSIGGREAKDERIVTIKRSDGKVFNVSSSQLNEEDRSYLDSIFTLEKNREKIDNAYKRNSPPKKRKKYEPNFPNLSSPPSTVVIPRTAG